MKHIHKILESGTPLDIDINVDDNQFYVQLASQCQCDERVKRLVLKSWKGFQSGHCPTLSDTGVGGTYFMHDARNRLVGVFKPHDEEFGCSNNPKGFTPQDHYLDVCLRHGVHKGEAAFRECAAYILDHNHFSGVPATDLVICNFPSFQNNSPPQHTNDEDVKFGSFQEFKEHDFDAEDIGPSKAALFPVREVHKIAVLDIRLFNTDRHGGNILVKEVDNSPASASDLDEELGHLDMQFQMDDDDEEEYIPKKPRPPGYELIPIDHGYMLPHSLSALSDSRFEWLNWPQSKVTFDNETMTFINSLDPRMDVALLQQRFPDHFSLESLNVLLIATLWLKVAANKGLTAHEIGCAMIRMDSEQPSKLEIMCRQAFKTDGASILESVIIDADVQAALIQSMEDACLTLKKVRDAQGMLRPKPRI